VTVTQPGDGRTILDVPITFDTRQGTTHVPMVEATVGGVSTKLILDTGSSDHVLTRELADSAALASEPGEPGTDSTGASVPSWTLGELDVVIAGRTFGLRDVVAIRGPGPFVGWGVGGFLSPQHLHPTAWVILDLAADRLALVEGDERALAGRLDRRSHGLRLLRLDRIPTDPTILVRAALDHFEPVVTLLDSGGKTTAFVASAVAGLGGGRRTGAGHGVGGGQIVGAVVENRTLVIADAHLPVARVVVRDEMDGHDGLVAMDVLRGTVLVVSADRSKPVFWLLPGSA
jgi:hypothetical protein